MDFKKNLAVAASALFVVILFHSLYGPELSGGLTPFLKVLDAILCICLLGSIFFMFKMDSANGPRWAAILLTIVIASIVGVACGQYRQDKADGITAYYVPEQERKV